jgi:hypothetical protein
MKLSAPLKQLTFILIKEKIIQCIVMYPTGMYSQLFKIGSEIYTPNFGYHYLDTLYLHVQGCEDL